MGGGDVQNFVQRCGSYKRGWKWRGAKNYHSQTWEELKGCGQYEKQNVQFFVTLETKEKNPIDMVKKVHVNVDFPKGRRLGKVRFVKRGGKGKRKKRTEEICWGKGPKPVKRKRVGGRRAMINLTGVI